MSDDYENVVEFSRRPPGPQAIFDKLQAQLLDHQMWCWRQAASERRYAKGGFVSAGLMLLATLACLAAHRPLPEWWLVISPGAFGLWQLFESNRSEFWARDMEREILRLQLERALVELPAENT